MAGRMQQKTAFFGLTPKVSGVKVAPRAHQKIIKKLKKESITAVLAVTS